MKKGATISRNPLIFIWLGDKDLNLNSRPKKTFSGMNHE